MSLFQLHLSGTDSSNEFTRLTQVVGNNIQKITQNGNLRI